MTLFDPKTGRYVTLDLKGAGPPIGPASGGPGRTGSAQPREAGESEGTRPASACDAKAPR